MTDSILQNYPSNNQLFVERVVIPTDDDILCGAGPKVCLHPGNVRFRNTILAHRDAYTAAKTRRDKIKVVTTVSRLLDDPNSSTNVTGKSPRFLRKDSIFDIWYIAPKQRKVARDKITHSFRDTQIKNARNNYNIIVGNDTASSRTSLNRTEKNSVRFGDQPIAFHEEEQHARDDDNLFKNILPLLLKPCNDTSDDSNVTDQFPSSPLHYKQVEEVLHTYVHAPHWNNKTITTKGSSSYFHNGDDDRHQQAGAIMADNTTQHLLQC